MFETKYSQHWRIQGSFVGRPGVYLYPPLHLWKILQKVSISHYTNSMFSLETFIKYFTSIKKQVMQFILISFDDSDVGMILVLVIDECTHDYDYPVLHIECGLQVLDLIDINSVKMPISE